LAFQGHDTLKSRVFGQKMLILAVFSAILTQFLEKRVKIGVFFLNFFIFLLFCPILADFGAHISRLRVFLGPPKGHVTLKNRVFWAF
jgi:hypothetical protein